MQQITSLTDYPNQNHTLILEDNNTVDFTLYFKPTQNSWYYNFSYNDLVVNGIKCVLSPNALRQFKNIIPFGFAFLSLDYVDPFKDDDFLTGRVGMYILNQEEVQEVEERIFLNED